MQKTLNSLFPEVETNFEVVPGSFDKIYFDKKSKTAVLAILNNSQSGEFNSVVKVNTKLIEHLSKRRQKGVYNKIYLAVFFSKGVKLINLYTLYRGLIIETLLSALEKTSRNKVKGSRSLYYLIEFTPNGFIKVDDKKFKYKSIKVTYRKPPKTVDKVQQLTKKLKEKWKNAKHVSRIRLLWQKEEIRAVMSATSKHIYNLLYSSIVLRRSAG
jgi:hypothetical protein